MSAAQISAAQPFWFRNDPAFCITGSVFSQPVGEGNLRAGYCFYDECGSLDAPQYLPTGGMRVDINCTGDWVYHTEHAQIDRERAAELAEPRSRHEDDFEFWGPDEERYAS